MALLSDIRRVFRAQTRVRSMTRELRDINTHLSVIAKALSVIVERDYNVDVYAPPSAVRAPESELTVTYVNDRDQAIREEQERIGQEILGYEEEQKSAEARMLDEMG